MNDKEYLKFLDQIKLAKEMKQSGVNFNIEECYTRIPLVMAWQNEILRLSMGLTDDVIERMKYGVEIFLTKERRS